MDKAEFAWTFHLDSMVLIGGLILPPPHIRFYNLFVGVMGCGAAEATDLGFVYFIIINPRVC